MKYWRVSEWISFCFHVAVVAIPLGIATTSQWHMWNVLFSGYWFMPWLLVGAVEVPALAMFGFHIYNIESRFVWMRHFIPFVSGVGLLYELHGMLRQNGEFVAWAVGLVVAGIFIYVSFGALASIEDLFVSADVAAQRLAERATREMTNTLGELTTRLRMARDALQAYDNEVSSVLNPVPALPEPSVIVTNVQADEMPPIIADNKTETIRVWMKAGKTARQLADATGWQIETIYPIWSKTKKAQEGT